MQVWLVHELAYGDVSVYAEATDVAGISFVADELGYLEGGYEDERAQFIDDLNRAAAAGSGSAEIEERVLAELVTVRTLS